MRILLHDYTGHPFQADLSRRLAERGHQVLHASCASFPAPKGRLERCPGDPEGLAFTALELEGDLDKYRFLDRWRLERGYGRRLRELIRRWRPEVALIGNTPLDPLAAAFAECRRLGIPKAFWVQDLYSIAISRYLGPRWGGLGRLVGWRYRRLEGRLARRAEAVIPISEGFLPTLAGWGVARDRIHVQPNWAALEEHPLHSGDNAWAAEQGVAGRRVLLYAGTLGLKHDPGLLATLAAGFAERDEVAVVVVSEGEGADWLRRRATERRLANLKVLPFQPVARVAEMMAAAELLLSSLEPGAGRFSVPSKILAQLCAGRPLLAAIPAENDAARMILEAGAGRVVPPGDHPAWLAAARELLDDPPLRRRLGENARHFAERRFDSHAIAERFETLLAGCLAMRGGAR
ncbi:glycosyltransferase family 4 protein [Endothiovibrio diazotrophicus]